MHTANAPILGVAPSIYQRIFNEKLIILSALIALIAYPLEHMLVSHGKGVAGLATVILVGAIIATAIRVAHHAEVLAEKVGDPYGTMILTLAAVLVEVVILAIMMQHSPSPTLARDTIYAAVMIDCNALMGIAALVGGLKHGEQIYNHDSGRVYVVMIITAIAISMAVPAFLPTGQWKVYSAFTIGTMILLYALFLRMQTKEHSYFFNYNYEKHEAKKRAEQAKAEKRVIAVESPEDDEEFEHESTRFSIMMMVVGIVWTGILAEIMSKTMGVSIEGSGLPPIFAALVVASISASPELLTAMRAAMKDRYQVVINIALGATLSTVILTVPVIEAIALFNNQDIEMALTPVQGLMLGVTLVVAGMNVSDGETNAIEGMTHFVIFMTFIMLCFLGL
jgi:Ca2+:H+ antiporter